MNDKMKAIASKVLELILEAKPLTKEFSNQTVITSEKIDKITEKKSSKGDQYASKIIRKKIQGLEKKVTDQAAKIKALQLENIKLKAEAEKSEKVQYKLEIQKKDLQS